MIFYSHRRIRKWVFRGALIVCGVGITFLVGVFLVGLLADSSQRPPVHIDTNYYNNIIGDQKIIALTFDDGPLPGRTTALMNVLKEEKVPATFFFIGSQALRYPDLVQEASRDGFEIGNHTFTHAETVQSSAWRLRLELNLTDVIIESITHQPVRLYRPPFLLGIGSDPTTVFPGSQTSLSWATNDGYVVVGADSDPKDWLAKSEQDVVKQFFDKLTPGRHLVLLHDGSSEHYTVGALKQIIQGLRDRGYTFATASQVLGLDAAKNMAITRNLQLGDTDTASDTSVSDLQHFLIMKGFPIDDHVGTFGSATKLALSNWQNQQRITEETGHVGFVTRIAIAQNVSVTMYQSPPPTTWQSIFLFSLVTHLYVLLAPITATGIFWIVRIVLMLVMTRLILMLLLRSGAAIQPPLDYPAWTSGVSVIVPAYNEEDNISSTLLSILSSSVERLEVLVMNDGSKDGTEEIVRRIEKKYPKRLRQYILKNGGKAQALNQGFKLARYDVVVTMDGDTIFDRDTIDRLVRHFHNPEVGAVAGKVCATSSKNILNLFQWAEYVITQNMDKEALNMVNAVGVVPGPVGAWRKSVVTRLGGYSLDTLVEDQDMTMALLANGYRVEYEPKAYAYSETPFRIKDFFKQRSRWIYGTIQCVWKYKRYLFSLRRPALGWAVLLNTVFFSIILSLLIPLMDILVVMALIVGFARSTFILYLIFMAIDLIYAILAFWHEKSHQWLIALLPFQRLFYRFVVALVVWRSLAKAIEGSESRWNKVRKRGDAQAHHLQMLNEPVPQLVASIQQKS